MWTLNTIKNLSFTQRLQISRRKASIFMCLATLPQAQFNSNGISEPPLLEPVVLHVLAPPFISAPSAEGSAVSSHGKKRCSLHRRKRNQTPSAGGASGRGLDLAFLGSHQHLVYLQESVFPSIIASTTIPAVIKVSCCRTRRRWKRRKWRCHHS